MILIKLQKEEKVSTRHLKKNTADAKTIFKLKKKEALNNAF
jgi:hypothetical protein